MAVNKNKISTVSSLQKYIRQVKKDGKELTAIPVVGRKGLTVRIRPTANIEPSVEFRHRYAHPILKTKRVNFTIGNYPAMTLENATTIHSQNLALLAQNICPKEQREKGKARLLNERQYTVDYFADAVMAQYAERQAKGTVTATTVKMQSRYFNNIKQAFKGVLLADITPTMLIEYLQNVSKTKTGNYTETIRIAFSMIYNNAITKEVVTTNYADTIRKSDKNIITIAPTNHRPAIVEPVGFAKLLNDIDNIPATFDHIKEILQMMVLLSPRIGDMCAMRWADIDFNNSLWDYTPQKKGGRKDMDAIITPLPRQAIAILKRMYDITGGTDYVFYTGKRKTADYTYEKRINRTLNAEIKPGKHMNDGKGYLNIHCPHGFRASAKTMLMEYKGYDNTLTEFQIGHKLNINMGKTYARNITLLAERMEMVQAWADYIDDLRAGKIDNMIYLQQAKKTKQA